MTEADPSGREVPEPDAVAEHEEHERRAGEADPEHDRDEPRRRAHLGVLERRQPAARRARPQRGELSWSR